MSSRRSGRKKSPTEKGNNDHKQQSGGNHNHPEWEITGENKDYNTRGEEKKKKKEGDGFLIFRCQDNAFFLSRLVVKARHFPPKRKVVTAPRT